MPNNVAVAMHAPAILEALRGDDGEMITEMRTSDGFVNATKMCKSAGVNFKDFTKQAGTRKFFAELAKEMGLKLEGDSNPLRIPEGDSNPLQDPMPLHELYPELIQVTHGGKHAGSWVIPQVAVRLAGWCSVKFSVQTSNVICRYMQGQVTTEESRAVAMTAPQLEATVDTPLLSTAVRVEGSIGVKEASAFIALHLQRDPRDSVGVMELFRKYKDWSRAELETQGVRHPRPAYLHGMLEKLKATVLGDPVGLPNTGVYKHAYIGWSFISDTHTNTATATPPANTLAMVPNSSLADTTAVAKMSDIVRPVSDANRWAIPLAYRPPNIVYIMCLGMLWGRMVWMWGMTTDIFRRRAEHRAQHPGCEVKMLIDVGLYNPKPLEDEMRLYFRDKETRIKKSNAKEVWECFVMDESDGYFARFRDFMVSGFPEIIRSVFFEGELVSYFNGDPCTVQPSLDTLTVELAKITLEIEQAKAHQEQAKAQQLQAKALLQTMQQMPTPTTPWK